MGDENKWEYRSISLKKVTLNISQSFTESKSPALIYATIANALASNADGLSMKGKDNKIIWTDKTDFYFGVKDKAKKLPRSPSEQLPILLLWSRYSGSLTPKGYFPEGDSDLRGQKQLLDMANKLQCQVITIGHDPNPELETKTDMDNAHSKDCHLGEFYKTAPITSDRDTQISFFLALMQQYPGRLYQIGQKTGGMDGAALLGIPTIYIECDSINPGARMSGWVDKVPFYRDANIFDPPSLLGKAVFKLRKWMIWEQDNNKITVQDTHASWYKGYESDFYNRILFPRPARFRLIALLYLLGKAITAIDKDLDRKLQGELQMEQERKERAEKYQAKKDPSTGKPSTGKPAIVPPANVDPMMALKIVNSFYPEYVVDEKWDLWMTGLNKLTNEELKPLNTFRGYATADLEKIKDKLTVLLTDYPKPSTIIRNENGEYVTRESNSKK